MRRAEPGLRGGGGGGGGLDEAAGGLRATGAGGVGRAHAGACGDEATSISRQTIAVTRRLESSLERAGLALGSNGLPADGATPLGADIRARRVGSARHKRAAALDRWRVARTVNRRH